MTVECQLKLSRHNSLERTWGHHLQYDRFRAARNKNWRELTGNSFTDHVTNTCSDDSRSRDFIVVWELRSPLRVLPNLKTGSPLRVLPNLKTETQYLVEKSEISGHYSNSKTRAKLKISVIFEFSGLKLKSS